MRQITSLGAALLLCAGAVTTYAQAQQPTRELTREWRDGDYIVRQYIVASDSVQNSEYEIHYAINSATTSPTFDQNGSELKRLDAFFDELKRDTLRHITSIAITGYASPDGTTQFNTELARQRAQQLSTMLDKRYMLKGQNITITSQVVPWSDTSDAIEHSSLDNSATLLRLVNSNEPPMTIDHKLKQEVKAWEWLKDDILPDMRRAVVVVSYTEDKTESSSEYLPVANQPTEIILVEEWHERPKEEHHKHKDAHHKAQNKEHKRGKHHRNVVIVDEWEGVIIDLGAASEGEAQ